MPRLRVLFTDLFGVLRGTEIPYSEDKELFKTMFDASSVHGFEEIHKSDLELRLPRERVKEIPWSSGWYGGIATIHYPGGERYVKDPRLVAEKTEEYLREQGYTAKTGVEMEFFIFRSVYASIDLVQQTLLVEAPEIPENNGYIPVKKGYHLVEPADEVAVIRDAIIKEFEKLGYAISKSHHEVATAGQVEITSKSYPVVEIGDLSQWFKYVAKTVAARNGFKAVFLPKPLPGDNGSGMHIHLSLWSNGKNLFYDPSDEHRLSQLAIYFIGGVLEHGRSLSAIVSPTVNSYRRLIPGYEAPTILAWAVGNRSVALRVPKVVEERIFRVEYRPPDPLANPYLAVSALLMAGLDGIKKKIDPGDPFQDDAYNYSLEELRRKGYKQLPRSLDEALDELETDNEYLKSVFPRELLETYIEAKRKEARELQAIPAPSEYIHYMYW